MKFLFFFRDHFGVIWDPSLFTFQQFCKKLIEELTFYIYVKPSNDILQWKRSTTNQTAFQRASSGRSSSGRNASTGANNSSTKSGDFLKVKHLTLDVMSHNQPT